jgi:hypothetical protein
MKISIEIDGAEAVVKTVQPTETTTVVAQTAPADLLARAAAIGALDAGPAPSGAGTSAEPMAFTSVGSGAPMGGAGDIAAGAAPAFT